MTEKFQDVEIPDDVGSESWQSVLDSVINMDLTTGYDPDSGTFDQSTRDIVSASKEILNGLFADSKDSIFSSVNSDIAKTSLDLADVARTGDQSIFSQIFKGAKETYGGLDQEGKKFVWGTLTGLLSYNHAKKTADATAKIAEAKMLEAQTGANALQNKIDLQGAVGKMNFKPRTGGGLIYQNIPGQKGL